MITTLDAQPQEWMEGSEHVCHTVAACHFNDLEHAEFWINRLVPKNQNGDFIKWSGGRRKEKTRTKFIENCLNLSHAIDFKVNCISTIEGEMSWFAWYFYMKNREFVNQQTDAKGRNCLVFKINDDKNISFPVLRAGYLIWYYHVIRYLTEFKKISGKFLSDNFACDEQGPGEGKAQGVAFVNFLLNQSKINLQISLPLITRFKQCDFLSDYFCGWINSIRSNRANDFQKERLEELEKHPKDFIDNIIFSMNLNITDEYGKDVTQKIKAFVAGENSNS